jgi:hypothetical protein
MISPHPTLRAPDLIGVHTVPPRHLRYRRAGRQCLFHNPPLLRFSVMLRRCRCAATEPSRSREVTAACWEVSISAEAVKKSSIVTSYIAMTHVVSPRGRLSDGLSVHYPGNPARGKNRQYYGMGDVTESEQAPMWPETELPQREPAPEPVTAETEREARLKPVNRNQLLLRTIDVDKLVERDHLVRALWELAGRLELRGFTADVESVEGVQGALHSIRVCSSVCGSMPTARV